MNGMKKANKALTQEHAIQSDIIYSSCFVILWEDYGWKENRIISRFAESVDIWMNSGESSVLECLEKETGIEMALDGEKSYHEFAYLSEDTSVKPIGETEKIYMYQRVVKWIPTMILATICLALHRTDHWGFNRLSRFIDKVNILRQILGADPKEYDKYLYEVTGHRTKEFWGK